jgi:hypothetical protein
VVGRCPLKNFDIRLELTRPVAAWVVDAAAGQGPAVAMASSACVHHGLEMDRTGGPRFPANQFRVLPTLAASVSFQERRRRAAGHCPHGVAVRRRARRWSRAAAAKASTAIVITPVEAAAIVGSTATRTPSHILTASGFRTVPIR